MRQLALVPIPVSVLPEGHVPHLLTIFQKLFQDIALLGHNPRSPAGWAWGKSTARLATKPVGDVPLVSWEFESPPRLFRIGANANTRPLCALGCLPQSFCSKNDYHRGWDYNNHRS